jgi:hypothetical protein
MDDFRNRLALEITPAPINIWGHKPKRWGPDEWFQLTLDLKYEGNAPITTAVS